MEQGRLAVCHMFKVNASSFPELFPYGVYTIPEISMVGRNEEELTRDGVQYEVGKARYREIARGQIIGDTTGLLEAMLKRDPRGAVLGLLIDPASARQAHAVGIGRAAEFRLGEISGVAGHVPLTGEFRSHTSVGCVISPPGSSGNRRFVYCRNAWI